MVPVLLRVVSNERPAATLSPATGGRSDQTPSRQRSRRERHTLDRVVTDLVGMEMFDRIVGRRGCGGRGWVATSRVVTVGAACCLTGGDFAGGLGCVRPVAVAC